MSNGNLNSQPPVPPAQYIVKRNMPSSPPFARPSIKSMGTFGYFWYQPNPRRSHMVHHSLFQSVRSPASQLSFPVRCTKRCSSACCSVVRGQWSQLLRLIDHGSHQNFQGLLSGAIRCLFTTFKIIFGGHQEHIGLAAPPAPS